MKYLLLFVPLFMLVICKYMYDTTQLMEWAKAWKMVVLIYPVCLLFLLSYTSTDRPFKYWCQSLMVFILVNNVWDVASDLLNVTYRMPAEADNPGRWLLFLSLCLTAIARTWVYKRDKKYNG